ncbi:MAG: hypothetical protein JNM17_08315, partial [Archangium sp.]|nr:hypothetical protein [Archangium sp.]
TWDTHWGGQGGRVACISPDRFFSFGSSYYNNETITLFDLSTGSGTTPVAEGIRVDAAYVASANDAWFVGDNGALLHWTGSMLVTNKPQRRQRVWAFSANDVWVLRGDDSMQRFDGTTWREESLPGSSVIVDVYAGSRDDVWLLRLSGVWHLTNNSWNQVSGFPAGTYYARGSATNDVWFSGSTGVVMHWNGTSLVSRFLPSSSAITGPMHVTATQRWVPTHTQNGISSTYQWTTQWVDRGALGWRFGGSGDEVYFNGVGSLSRWLSGQSTLVSDGIQTDLISASSASLYVARATYTPGGQRNALVRVALGTTQVNALETGISEPLSSLSVTPDGHVWLTTIGGGLLHQKP